MQLYLSAESATAAACLQRENVAMFAWGRSGAAGRGCERAKTLPARLPGEAHSFRQGACARRKEEEMRDGDLQRLTAVGASGLRLWH